MRPIIPTTTLWLASVLTLVGCATDPMRTEDATPAEMLNSQYATPTPESGRVIVKRDTSFMRTGFGCKHRVYVDGTPVAELMLGQAATLHLPAGEHVLSAELTSICHGTSEMTVVVAAGQTKTLRTSADGDGNIRIQPTAF